MARRRATAALGCAEVDTPFVVGRAC